MRQRAEKSFVGVISDTHGLLRPEAVAALRGATLILHAGDVGSKAVLEALGRIAPVIAVRGNNDRDAWGRSLPEVTVTELAGVRTCVIHEVNTLRLDPAKERIDVVVSGHSHRPSVARRDGVLWLNPGSAGPRRFSLPVTVARLRIRKDAVDAEIVPLDVPAARSAPRAGARVGRRSG